MADPLGLVLNPLMSAIVIFVRRDKKTQDRLDHRFIPSVNIDHCMIKRPVGPVGMKVIPDENGAFMVDCIY